MSEYRPTLADVLALRLRRATGVANPPAEAKPKAPARPKTAKTATPAKDDHEE